MNINCNRGSLKRCTDPFLKVCIIISPRWLALNCPKTKEKEESELRFEKLGLFEFKGQNEMTILSSKKGMVAECAWPELFYRKLVVGFLGVLFLTCLVKVF